MTVQDEIRARLSLADIVGRKVRLVRKGREYVGLCPFHNEKTPSFGVVEEKGFYHCFGCGAHGDLFTFVMETEGLGFREALERLADEAGVALPAPSAQGREEAQARSGVMDVLAEAATFFADELRSPRGAEARAYLKGRGLDSAVATQFGLGYAPGTGTAVMQHFKAKGMPIEALREAGLLIREEEGREARDLFRHRVMFPIRDARGRVIAFGGRALSPDAKPKYINSPETRVFDKGRTLYNLDKAREPAHRAREIIAAEGYLDVIALTRAGIGQAVAPLGTALTETQLEMMWRIAPEPTLCFDGDAAGLRAAHRAAERALPLLKPGQSLRFVLLPEGRDPDDILRDEGAEPLKSLVSEAMPLIDLLWTKELAGVDLRTPERRAGLETRLFQMLDAIGDQTVKGHYRADFKARLDQLFGRGARETPVRSERRWPRDAAARPRPVGPDPVLAQNALARRARQGLGSGGLAREEALLLGILRHPFLLDAHYEAIQAISLSGEAMTRLRDALLGLAAEGLSLDSQGVCDHLAQRGFAETIKRLMAQPALALLRFTQADASAKDVEGGWLATLARCQDEALLRDELRQARGAWARDPSEANRARMNDIEQRLSRFERPMTGEAGTRAAAPPDA